MEGGGIETEIDRQAREGRIRLKEEDRLAASPLSSV